MKNLYTQNRIWVPETISPLFWDFLGPRKVDGWILKPNFLESSPIDLKVMRFGVRPKVANSFHVPAVSILSVCLTYLEDKNLMHYFQGSLFKSSAEYQDGKSRALKGVYGYRGSLFLLCLQCTLWVESHSYPNLSQLLKRNELRLTRLGIHT